MLKVGLWIPLPKGTHWQGEGIARTIEFIVNGMVQEGLVGDDISMTIYTNYWAEDSILKSFEELLGSDFNLIRFEFVTKSLVPEFLMPSVTLLADIMFARPVLLDRKLDRLSKRMSLSELKSYYRLHEHVKLGSPQNWSATVREPASNSGFAKAVFQRRMRTFQKKHGFRLEELRANYEEIVSSRNKDAQMRKSFRRKNSEVFFDKFQAGIGKLPFGRRILNRLLARAEENAMLRAVHRFSANDFPDVDVWWVPSPLAIGAELLGKPTLTNFYDFFVGEFGYYWGKVQVQEIFYRVSLVLSQATAVITQSRFNKYDKLPKPLNVEPERVFVCNFACPVHYSSYVAGLTDGTEKSESTISTAADIIREEMALRARSSDRHESFAKVGLQYTRLENFDFEKEKFVVISTQNRPYKNLKFVIDILPKILEAVGDEVYFFFTAEIDLSDNSDPLVKKIIRKRLQEYIFSVPRLPDRVHANLYHCATMTLHPSLSEGGVGAYPFMEGMTVGTPGLTGTGEHTKEGRLIHDNYDLVTYRNNDEQHAVERISQVLNDPNGAYKTQLPIFEAHKKWSWRRVATIYRDAFWETSGRQDFTTKMLGKENGLHAYYEERGRMSEPHDSDSLFLPHADPLSDQKNGNLMDSQSGNLLHQK